MNYLDLFSGIAGFAKGAYDAGWRFDKHYFSEVDEYAIKVYQRRFPDAIPLGDIRKIDTKVLAEGAYQESAKSEGKALADSNGEGLAQRESEPGDNGQERQAAIRGSSEWIITGGFPCTDISVAGKGAGITGRQSGLWFEMRRIIRDLRPRYAIIENVAALTFRGLPRVLSSLAEIGYDAEWTDIRASDLGAPHKRERIWIVAYPSSDLRRTSGDERPVASDGASQDVADAEGIHAQGCNGGQGQGQFRGSSRGTALGGLGDLAHGLSPWLAEPDIPRVSRGEKHRVDKLKCLGNSIVPQIAEMIFRQIR